MRGAYLAAMATMLALTHDYGYDARHKNEHGKNGQPSAESGHRALLVRVGFLSRVVPRA